MARMVRCSTCPAIALFLLSGCGTVMNLRTADSGYRLPESHVPRTVYGGVKLDAAAGRRSFDAAAERPGQAVVGAVVWGVDLPISAVADTLTLPLTIPAAIGRGINEYYFPEDDAAGAALPIGNGHSPRREPSGDGSAVRRQLGRGADSARGTW